VESKPPIAETNRIPVVLFGMHNRNFGPYMAAMHRTLVLGMPCGACLPKSYGSP
jgi:hypothetical protein